MTPITSCHGMEGNSLNCLPMAAEGVPHISRARFSETITTGRRRYTSVHVSPRPATMRVPAVRKKSGETCLNSRSEEHTSELQSRLHLVCRLLLEKTT